MVRKGLIKPVMVPVVERRDREVGIELESFCLVVFS